MFMSPGGGGWGGGWGGGPPPPGWPGWNPRMFDILPDYDEEDEEPDWLLNTREPWLKDSLFMRVPEMSS